MDREKLVENAEQMLVNTDSKLQLLKSEQAAAERHEASRTEFHRLKNIREDKIRHIAELGEVQTHRNGDDSEPIARPLGEIPATGITGNEIAGVGYATIENHYEAESDGISDGKLNSVTVRFWIQTDFEGHADVLDNAPVDLIVDNNGEWVVPTKVKAIEMAELSEEFFLTNVRVRQSTGAHWPLSIADVPEEKGATDSINIFLENDIRTLSGTIDLLDNGLNNPIPHD